MSERELDGRPVEGVRMVAEDRWQRLARPGYQVLGWSLLALGILLAQVVPRVVYVSEGVRALLALAGLALVLAGATPTIGVLLHRGFEATREEVRRNPTGGEPAPSLEERLHGVTHLRTRIVWALLIALLADAGVVWFVLVAITRHDSSAIGFAIALAPLALMFSWLAWRSRPSWKIAGPGHPAPNDDS